MIKKLKNITDLFKKEIKVYRCILKHKQTPLLSKILLWSAVTYIMLPVDLIPDFIPVIGHLDDIIIIPLLIYFAMKFIPSEIIEHCRKTINTTS